MLGVSRDVIPTIRKVPMLSRCASARSPRLAALRGRTFLGPTAYAVGFTDIAPPGLRGGGSEWGQLAQWAV